MHQNTPEKRTVILETAKKLIINQGIKLLSVQDLAKEAGVAASTIYKLFKNKDELIQETRIYVTKTAADIIESELSDNMPLKEKYRSMWMSIWKIEIDLIAMKEEMFRKYGHKGTNTDLIIREKHMFVKLDQFFEDGKKQGLFKDYDNFVLYSASLETAVNLANKTHYDFVQITQDDIDMVIETSWNMLLLNPGIDQPLH